MGGTFCGGTPTKNIISFLPKFKQHSVFSAAWLGGKKKIKRPWQIELLTRIQRLERFFIIVVLLNPADFGPRGKYCLPINMPENISKGKLEEEIRLLGKMELTPRAA